MPAIRVVRRMEYWPFGVLRARLGRTHLLLRHSRVQLFEVNSIAITGTVSPTKDEGVSNAKGRLLQVRDAYQLLVIASLQRLPEAEATQEQRL